MVGTEFEKKVWKTTKKIPKGKVVTYGQIAEVIGCPKAARAVGNALNKNPFAPQVPCHRVVRSDGNLGGYAGGAKKKRRLLEWEGIKVENNRIDSRKYLL